MREFSVHLEHRDKPGLWRTLHVLADTKQEAMGAADDMLPMWEAKKAFLSREVAA